MFPFYKVRHPWFGPDLAYRPVWYVLNGDTAWGHLVFVVPSGHTYAVQVWRCTALPGIPCEGTLLCRPLTKAEREFPAATKPIVKNPDLETDL